jgi:hypothetical protein
MRQVLGYLIGEHHPVAAPAGFNPFRKDGTPPRALKNDTNAYVSCLAAQGLAC